MDLYFRPNRIERWKNGKLYEILGIKNVKKVCVYIGNAFGWDNYFIGDRSAEGLRAYEKRTRISEAIHGPVTMLLVYRMIFYLVEGAYVGAAIVGVVAAANGLPTTLHVPFMEAAAFVVNAGVNSNEGWTATSSLLVERFVAGDALGDDPAEFTHPTKRQFLLFYTNHIFSDFRLGKGPSG